MVNVKVLKTEWGRAANMLVLPSKLNFVTLTTSKSEKYKDNVNILLNSCKLLKNNPNK